MSHFNAYSTPSEFPRALLSPISEDASSTRSQKLSWLQWLWNLSYSLSSRSAGRRLHSYPFDYSSSISPDSSSPIYPRQLFAADYSPSEGRRALQDSPRWRRGGKLKRLRFLVSLLLVAALTALYLSDKLLYSFRLPEPIGRYFRFLTW